MTLDDIIARVIAECPSFATVRSFQNSSENMPLPAAIVEPIERRSPVPQGYMGGHIQTVNFRFGVYLMMERRLPDNFTPGGPSWDALCAELQAALCAWTNGEPNVSPVSYAGGAVVPFRDQIACWREDFATDFQIRITP